MMETKLWLPLVIAVSVSSLFAVVLNGHYNFWSTFFVATVVQFIIGSILNKILVGRAYIELKRLNVQQIAEEAKQVLKLTCPCTNQVEQIVPIRLDRQNFYKCINCTKNINVGLSVKTALMTDIIDLDASHQQMAQALASVTTQIEDE